MNRRQLLLKSAFAMGAFALARDMQAQEEVKRMLEKAGTDPAKPVRLNANENPHGPSPKSRQAMMEAVAISNRYQWDTNGLLREEIGRLTGHTRDHITLGAGSSELLGLVSLWSAYKKGHVVASEPTFKLWMPAARRMGLSTKLVPLTTSKHNDLQRLMDTADSEVRMVYLCNPNNPTGTVNPEADLETFVRRMAPDRIVLMDEAYTEYHDSPSMSRLVNEFPNLIIAKTFSKVHGMAGARVGYLLAQPSTIKQLNEFQAWANAGPSAVSMLGARAALTDSAFVSFCKSENIKAKEVLYRGFKKAGIPYIPSVTSFVYFDAKDYPRDIPKLMAENGILGGRSFEEKSSWLRISIGTVAEMEKVVSLL
jgi:histidinol-phosphate aminotransferase